MGRPAEESPWVKVGGVYHVLSIWIDATHTRFRLVGEEAAPALFEPEMFEVVSPKVPTSWLVTSPKPGCFSLEPEAWTVPGFWERFFDDEVEAIASFREERARIVADDP
jgi:hypothetical protein